MNQHILIAMDWKNRSNEELNENYTSAAGCAHAPVTETVANAAHAASLVSSNPANAEFNAAKVEYYLNLFFRFPEESREDYEKALKEMK